MRVPGAPRYGFRYHGKIGRGKDFRVGQDLPVQVDPEDPNELSILWDDVPDLLDVVSDRLQGVIGALGGTADAGAGAVGQIGQLQQLAQQMSAQVDLGAVAQAASIMSNPGFTQQLLAYRERAMKLFQRGIDAQATVRAVRPGRTSPLLGGTEVELDLTVRPPDGSPYDVSTQQVLQPAALEGIVAGAEVAVRIDPDDPQSVLFWGTPAA